MHELPTREDRIGEWLREPGDDVDRFSPSMRRWSNEAVDRIKAESLRSADTHLLSVPIASDSGVDIYLKDESTHLTGSLKHRLARSLFLYALCNGWLRPDRPVIEASSGSTAVSEAYFARLIGVPFVAVVARGTSSNKIDLIRLHGGEVHFVDRPADICGTAEGLAVSTGGHFMDQFTYAERATDWRGNNNIAESLFAQLARERHPEPTWIVATAGTGGTSATIGRYLRYTGRSTGLCVADPDHSAFFPGWRDGDPEYRTERGSRIEGIGRQRVEPSFMTGVVDRMIRVPDAAAVAAIHFLAERTGLRAGASTGTGFWAALHLAAEMRSANTSGSIVGLLCDGGDRYGDMYYSPAWLHEAGIDPAPYTDLIEQRFPVSQPF